MDTPDPESENPYEAPTARLSPNTRNLHGHYWSLTRLVEKVIMFCPFNVIVIGSLVGLFLPLINRKRRKS